MLASPLQVLIVSQMSYNDNQNFDLLILVISRIINPIATNLQYANAIR